MSTPPIPGEPLWFMQKGEGADKGRTCQLRLGEEGREWREERMSMMILVHMF